MSYTEIYVLPVKAARLDDYSRFADETGRIWRQNGALSVVEYIAADVRPGVHTSFPQAVKLEADEVVAVGVIQFESRDVCERAKAALREDPLFSTMSMEAIPVDGRRMFWGGFTTVVELT
jgi:uncharacterized protein YbaA (DUF1428 family)